MVRRARPRHPSRHPPPPPPAPALDACYRLSYDEAVAPTNDDAPIACDKGHTTQTFAVGQLDLVTNGHLLAVDSEAVRTQVAHRCPAQLAAYVGATDEQLRLSLLRPVWFTPTIEQSDAGAAWYRCDVIAVSGDKRVAKIDRNLAGALKKPEGRTEFAMCGTAQPGTPEFSRVLCGEDHSWKAISVIDLAEKSKDGSYPGPNVGQGRGRRRLRGRRPCDRRPTRWTTSGATSGRPRTSGRPVRPTADAGHPIRPDLLISRVCR